MRSRHTLPSLRSFRLALSLLVVAACGAWSDLRADTVTLNVADAGIYSSSGFSSATNTSYFVGRSSTTGVVSRNFFVFDLSGIPVGVTSATLQILAPANSFVGADASNTVTFYDVVTPAATLTAGSPTGAGGQAIFADLGSGLEYGSLTVTPGDGGAVLSVTLSPAAIAAINLARGNLFAVGGALTTLSATGPDGLFSGSSAVAGSSAVRLVVSNDAAPVPEPTTFALLGAGLAGLYARRRRGSHKRAIG